MLALLLKPKRTLQNKFGVFELLNTNPAFGLLVGKVRIKPSLSDLRPNVERLILYRTEKKGRGHM